MKNFVICLSLIFFLSCEISVNTEMYVSDIIEFMNKKTVKKELLLNCSVEFEISSKDSYNENPDKFNNMISSAFYDAKDPYISERDMKTILSAKSKIYFGRELVETDADKQDEKTSETESTTDNETEVEKSLVYFTSDEDEKYINIYLNFEKDKYYQLNSAVKENTYNDIELKDFLIGIEIQNDLTDPCEIIVNASYVDNEPVLYNKSFTVEKREKLKIDLTTIFKDYTFQNGKECIMKIVKQQNKKEAVLPENKKEPVKHEVNNIPTL